MTVYKVRVKKNGLFVGRRGSSPKGRIYNQKNHVSTSFDKKYAVNRTDIEVVEYELVEKAVHQPKDFFKINNMETLIIDRSKWRTGSDNNEHKTGTGDTLLLNKDGFMCCLGFECLRLGFLKDNILNIGEPCDVYDPTNPVRFYHKDSFVRDAIKINDNPTTTLEEKEEKLIPLFHSVGINLQFINKPYGK